MLVNTRSYFYPSARTDVILPGMCSHPLGVLIQHCLKLKALCLFWIPFLHLYLNPNLGLRTLNFIPGLPSRTLTFVPSFTIAHHSDSGLQIFCIYGSCSKIRDMMVKSSGLWNKATQVPVLTPALTAVRL